MKDLLVFFNFAVMMILFAAILLLAFGCATRYDPMPKWHGYELQFKDQSDGK